MAPNAASPISAAIAATKNENDMPMWVNSSVLTPPTTYTCQNRTMVTIDTRASWRYLARLSG
jgi:hypothetical protein